MSDERETIPLSEALSVLDPEGTVSVACQPEDTTATLTYIPGPDSGREPIMLGRVLRDGAVIEDGKLSITLYPAQELIDLLGLRVRSETSRCIAGSCPEDSVIGPDLYCWRHLR